MSCRFIPTDGEGLECDTTGNLPACQLCPDSPTYWRNQDWDDVPPRLATDEETVAPPAKPSEIVLDWSNNGPDGRAPWINPPRPCVQCGKPSHLLSPGRKQNPLHKACAEKWIAEHPEAYRARTAGADRLEDSVDR